MNSAESKKREEEYRAEEDLRTITRAEEVRADQKRMAGVSRIQRKQLTALQRVGKAINGTPKATGTGTTRKRRRGASQRA
jgi:hypothetical protein